MHSKPMNNYCYLSAMAGVASLLVVGASPVQANVSAAVCDTASPNFLALGDDYYTPTTNLDSRLLNEREARAGSKLAEQLLQSLSRHTLKHGSGHRIICLGTGDTARAVKVSFDLEQLEMRSRASGFGLLTAFEDRHTIDADRAERFVNNTIVPENIELPPPHAWKTAPDGVSVINNRRFRRTGATQVRDTNAIREPDALGSNANALIEIDLQAKRRSGTSIEISQTVYVNGYRSDHVTWLVSTR